MMRGKKSMNKVKFDCEHYLNMIEQAQKLDDLPVIRVKLKRPIITFGFIYCLLFSIVWISVVMSSLSKFDWEFLIFVWFSFLPIAMLIHEYQRMNLKLFNPKQQDIYYCELTQNGFKWVFNEQVKEILWHNFMSIKKFMTSRYDYARIEISPTDSQLGKNDIILYDAHLPCYYRDLYKVIVQYREKHRQLVISSI